MNTTTTTPTTTFCGWYRPSSRQPWRQLVKDCETYNQALDALLNETREFKRGDVIVCRADRPPTERKM